MKILKMRIFLYVHFSEFSIFYQYLILNLIVCPIMHLSLQSHIVTVSINIRNIIIDLFLQDNSLRYLLLFLLWYHTKRRMILKYRMMGFTTGPTARIEEVRVRKETKVTNLLANVLTGTVRLVNNSGCLWRKHTF